MHHFEKRDIQENAPELAVRLAVAERALLARDKTVKALIERAKDRQKNQHSAFASLEENAALQQVVARKTLELETQNRRLEAAHTALKHTQQELLHAQKLESIGQLAAGIAHEINTPTQFIGDNLRFVQESLVQLQTVLSIPHQLFEALRENCITPELVQTAEATLESADLEYLREEIPKAIKESLQGVERVTKIVRAMKDFSHPGTTEKTQVDLNQAIDSTLTVARNEWKYVAELVTDFDPDLPPIMCLPGEFNQVILNLMVNAAHAIGDTLKARGGVAKGTITVSTRGEGDWVTVRVADTGSGIPESARGKVFDPFFTTKAVGKGTGQGLAIARSVIVDKHGGEISFETELGKGTVFIIRMPMAATPRVGGI